MNVCPSCGTLNPDSAKFCLECGTRLTPSEPVTTVPPLPESEQPTAPIEVSEPVEEPAEDAAPAEPPQSDADAAPVEDRPKKDVSGLPPSWMPAPVTLTMKPSGASLTPVSPRLVTPTTTTTTTPRPAPFPPIAEPGDTAPIEDRPAKDVSGLPPAWMPTPVDLGAPRTSREDDAPVGSDWKMSDPGPLPDKKDRRLWLWIPVGLITVVLICCIAFFIWATTIGSDTVDGWATNAAVNQTEEATSGD